MTQEDKELLLKDLCSRLPYGVKGHYKYYDIIGGRECLTDENDGDITSIDINLGNPIKINGYYTEVEYVKPYLRPMSSMTEEEKEELSIIRSEDFQLVKQWVKSESIKETGTPCPVTCGEVDFCNKHHLDYRGLIPMGLALEAPEGMYDK